MDKPEAVQQAVTFTNAHIPDRDCDGVIDVQPRQTDTLCVSIQSDIVEAKVEKALQLQGDL